MPRPAPAPVEGRQRLGAFFGLALVAGALGLAPWASAQESERVSAELSAGPGEGRLLNAVAAWVGMPGGQPPAEAILRSDVYLRASLARGAASRRQSPALLAAAMEELIAEILMSREAERLGLRAATPADLAAVEREVLRRAGGEEGLRAIRERWELEDDEWGEILRRRARARLFLNENLQPGESLDEENVARAYAEEEHPFQGRSLEDVRPALRRWLRNRQVEAAVARWLRILSERTPTRRLVRWTSP